MKNDENTKTDFKKKKEFSQEYPAHLPSHPLFETKYKAYQNEYNKDLSHVYISRIFQLHNNNKLDNNGFEKKKKTFLPFLVPMIVTTNNKTIFDGLRFMNDVDDGLEETAVSEIGLYDDVQVISWDDNGKYR